MSTHDPAVGTDPGGSARGATAVRDRVKDSAREAGEQVQEKTQEVGGQARERFSSQVDERTTAAGRQMQSVAGALRQTSGNLRQDGNDQPAAIVDGLAERVERFGSYLERTDANGFVRGVEDFGRRRPWALAGIGAAVGLAASRFLKASSQTRAGVQSRDGGPRPERALERSYPAESAVPATAGAAGVTTPPPRDPASPGGI